MKPGAKGVSLTPEQVCHTQHPICTSPGQTAPRDELMFQWKLVKDNINAVDELLENLAK